MSITSNFPAIKPTLLLDFANTKQLDSRITFTRASTATYYGTQTAKAEENLLVQSQDFTTTWVNQATTDTTNTTVAPDGTTTADTITASAGAATHSIIQTITPPSGTNVLSVFAKAGTNNYIQLFFGGQTGTFANFDITAGAGATGTSSGVVSTAITSEGNNWYRCVVIFTQSTATSVQIGLVSSSSAVRAESWTTAGTETVILWGAQLEQRSAVTAYTVTTTATITNYIPQLLTAASGVARFDNNPTTFESLGLEIEESRTNLLTYSEQFDDASWTKANSTITANTIVSPDGTLTGDKLVADATSNFHTVFRAFSFTSGTAYTLSIFAKAGEYQYLSLTAGNTGTFPARVTFDLISGTVSSTVSGTGSIQSVGNGWYRCSVSATATATASTGVNFAASSTGSYVTYTGNGYSGIYIWGAQLEAGAFATSYIPTVASQVTRAADAASMTGTNFSSWYNQAEGSFYSDFAFTGLTGLAGQRVFQADDGSNSNYIGTISNSLSAMQNIITRNGVAEATLSTPATTYIANTFNKIAVGFANNNSVAAVNNVLGTADTSCLLPLGVTSLRFGASVTSVNANLLIRKIAYYPLRVTDAQLQGLTS